MREPIINIAIEAARSAGNLILRSLDRLDTIKVAEKNPNDFVTDIDHRVEEMIISTIKRAHPTHSILGEEGGEREGDECKWIIDPIDGTRNFIHGLPHFAISIAYSYKNRMEHGVIYDPVRDELFTASRGRGAFLNNRRIRVSKCKQLDSALLGTGFAYRHSNSDNQRAVESYKAITDITLDLRRAGAATLDLAYVACGRLDGFWEFGLKPWDIAAGMLLVKEAGGMVCDPQGGEDYFKNGDIVACNPTLMRQFIKTIRPCTSSDS